MIWVRYSLELLNIHVQFCFISDSTILSEPSDHRCLTNVGLLIKPTNLQLQCYECADYFASSQDLRNHLAVHKKFALQLATLLTIPSSRRKRRRKIRRSSNDDAQSDGEMQVDQAQSGTHLSPFSRQL
ncbi:hypothetical protein CEXT_179191 [Caerostris extrusa]|uniref:C2H2-type domain-containing protein n=1 Tax=Caerostris extrusa TaxID=172846 RepID=A0AAV4QT61_CAEEX|nr:hypothetical protein CEXT_179191 [Caerostris extrusa]